MSVHISYSISISNQNNCASMNECFTDLIFGNFNTKKKRETGQVVQKRTEERLRKRLVIQ